MTDNLDLFIDLLAFCAGPVVMIWLGLQSSQRTRAINLPSGAVIGMLVWLAGLGLAVYLIFG